jgi:hypothetical protein
MGHKEKGGEASVTGSTGVSGHFCEVVEDDFNWNLIFGGAN